MNLCVNIHKFKHRHAQTCTTKTMRLVLLISTHSAVYNIRNSHIQLNNIHITNVNHEVTIVTHVHVECKFVSAWQTLKYSWKMYQHTHLFFELNINQESSPIKSPHQSRVPTQWVKLLAYCTCHTGESLTTALDGHNSGVLISNINIISVKLTKKTDQM